MRYGEGILSYLKLQDKLMLAFVVLSAIALVNACIYKSFNGLSSDVPTEVQYSFGNMGFPTSLCVKGPVSINQESTPLMISCENTTQITGVLTSGLLDASDSNVLSSCYIDQPIDYEDQP